MTEAEVKRVTQALVALQSQIIQFHEKKAHDKEALGYYNELCEDIRRKSQMSIEYAYWTIQNPQFLDALASQLGNF